MNIQEEGKHGEKEYASHATDKQNESLGKISAKSDKLNLSKDSVFSKDDYKYELP